MKVRSAFVAPALARLVVCVAVTALACGPGSGDGGGSGRGGAMIGAGGHGGATGVAGTLGSAGATGSGGTGRGGGAGRGGMGGSEAGGGGATGSAGAGGSGATGGGGQAGASNGGAGQAGNAAGRGGQAGGGQSGGAGRGGMGAQAGKGGQAGGAGGSGGAAGGAGAGAGGAAGGSNGSGSTGCGKTSTLSFTTVPGESGQNVGTGDGGYVTIQSGGGTRGFALRLPANYDRNKPYWLIFGFHWNGGTSKDVDTGGSNGYVMAHFGLQKLSNNGAIFVAPQGLGNGWGNSGGQDLKFVDDMVALIENNYCVDTKHVLTNGFSYGGGMSYELACARAKVFRGAAIYEGAQLSGCDGGNDPIALWQMVGLTDTTCPMNLATPIRDRFVKNNGCTAQSPPQPPNPPPYVSPGGHVCTDYAGCSAGHPLRWCVHQSGHGNAVVDGTSDLYNSCATPPKTCSSTCPCTWVPADVWSFFTAL
jgi:poly(3-hydroxybutyrate) depolymerase